jgi:glutamate-1-semialdehyde 2,1-aminomutase
MDALAPLGPVYQAGTLSGNPLATACGIAALDLLDEHAFSALAHRADTLASGLAKGFAEADVDVAVSRFESLVGVHFGTSAPTDFDGAVRTDEELYGRWFHGLLERGVAIAPGAYEVLFPGLSHSDEVISSVIDASCEVAASLAGG